jgi:hypothetical protein
LDSVGLEIMATSQIELSEGGEAVEDEEKLIDSKME